MNKADSIEAFYARQINWMPENLKKEIGHFNVFRVQDFVGPQAKAIPFNRKDYYKISLVLGRNRYSYADKIIEIDEPALVFTNPLTPYKCERLDENQEGYFCIFTEAFFAQFGNIKKYPVFEPTTIPIYFPSAAEVEQLKAFYEQLFLEMTSEYAFKYDLIRAQVLQVVHRGIKMKPAEATFLRDKNATTRIASLFVELLERQFPLELPMQRMRLRMPADFAAQLAVHINHLNRALKAVTGKTTSQLVAERLVQEASTLLKQTDCNVAEIGYCLGFEQSSHFIAFFRKHAHQTPNSYRHRALV